MHLTGVVARVAVVHVYLFELVFLVEVLAAYVAVVSVVETAPVLPCHLLMEAFFDQALAQILLQQLQVVEKGLYGALAAVDVGPYCFSVGQDG